MSYIQIEIGGKLRGLKFNQGALIMFTQKVDFDNHAATANYAMIYAGLYSNCYVKQQDPDFTFEQVVDWVDELEKDVLDKVADVFSSTTAFQKLINLDGDGIDTKKKPMKRKGKV